MCKLHMLTNDTTENPRHRTNRWMFRLKVIMFYMEKQRNRKRDRAREGMRINKTLVGQFRIKLLSRRFTSLTFHIPLFIWTMHRLKYMNEWEMYQIYQKWLIQKETKEENSDIKWQRAKWKKKKKKRNTKLCYTRCYTRIWMLDVRVYAGKCKVETFSVFSFIF